MLQILVMLSRDAIELLQRRGSAIAVMAELDATLSNTIAEVFEIPVHDIATSVLLLTFIHGEANVQIKVRYTVGEDEYGQGRPFDPPMEKRKVLQERILDSATKLTGMTCSVWVIPCPGSTFTTNKAR